MNDFLSPFSLTGGINCHPHCTLPRRRYSLYTFAVYDGHLSQPVSKTQPVFPSRGRWYLDQGREELDAESWPPETKETHVHTTGQGLKCVRQKEKTIHCQYKLGSRCWRKEPPGSTGENENEPCRVSWVQQCECVANNTWYYSNEYNLLVTQGSWSCSTQEQCLDAGFYTSRFSKGDYKRNSYSVPGQKKTGLGPAKHSVARISWSTE